MPIQTVISTSKVPVKIWTDDVEPQALAQLTNTGNMPGLFKHIAVMPDVHLGMGATIGSVVATTHTICPAAVGVDIGCGMMAVPLNAKASMLEGKLAELRTQIEWAIPVGRNLRGKPVEGYAEVFRGFSELTKGVQQHMSKAQRQLGTLGGGNHFIEICLDEEEGVWVMLHSGSRHIGNTIARVHIENAKGLMKQYMIELPDPDLAYFAEKTPEFKAYWHDLEWAQNYAYHNRRVMMDAILNQCERLLGEEVRPTVFAINCHHNYATREHHFGENVIITRKGAVRARLGDMGIIPGSMGVSSYIVKGVGNADSFHSCAHGAGRRMSRTAARAKFNTDDLAAQTVGVECRKDAGVVDEIPGAYKDIDKVMADQSDLVEIVTKLKQVICVKG